MRHFISGIRGYNGALVQDLSFLCCYKFYNPPKRIRGIGICYDLPKIKDADHEKPDNSSVCIPHNGNNHFADGRRCGDGYNVECHSDSVQHQNSSNTSKSRNYSDPCLPPPSGEVVFPITRHVTPTPTTRRTTIPATPTILRTTISPTPTIPRTTVTATPTISPTTIPVPPTILQTSPSATPTVPPTTILTTQTTSVPVVTVTVFVYPSGSVYRPAYYYPAGYPYDSSSYYPPYYPYDVNSYYSTGTLTVTSNPPGATVIVDEYNSELTPWVFTGLPTGYHTVEVIYPGYDTYTTNVYVDTGASIEVNADLNGQVSYGSMFINSNPQGADVYVDGNYQGTSPVTVGAMSEGSHQVEIHLAGYEVLTTTEYVSAGQGTVVNLAMVPYSSSSAEGSIDITSNLPGALVYLDGIYKGATQAGTTFNVIAVSPGSHTILLHVPGYTDFTQTVQVNAGQISNINPAFTAQQNPVPSSPATGSIIVTSTPTGGQVYVDNQLRGAAPVTIYTVATGTHIINLKLAGLQ